MIYEAPKSVIESDFFDDVVGASNGGSITLPDSEFPTN